MRIGDEAADQWVMLTNARDPYVEHDVVTFTAVVHGAYLDASTAVRTYEARDGLRAFFAGLAADWRGWEGVRRWEALEHDMAIEARSDRRGHVTLRITVRESYRPNAWEATVSVIVEAGEEMASLADAINSFL